MEQNNMQSTVQNISISQEEEARAYIAALHAYVQSVNELTRDYQNLLENEAEVLSGVDAEEGKARDAIKAASLRLELGAGSQQ